MFSSRSVICLLSLFFLSNCASPTAVQEPADSGSGTASEAPGAEMTDAELRTLAGNYVTSLKALNAELKPSGIHGPRVKTFLDEAALQAYQSDSFPYGANAVSVKESHASEQGPINRVYVMKKIPGYDPQNNDWFYAVMSTDGEARQKGKVQFCINCHRDAKDRDYIFGFK